MTINKITAERVEMFQNVLESPTIDGNALDIYQQIATQHANYPGKDSAFGLNYIVLAASGEAGEMANNIKKAMRDEDFLELQDHDSEIQCLTFTYKPLTTERKAKLIKEAGGVLWYLAALANELKMQLSDIALANLEELAGRTERGTLRGDGER